MSFKKKRNRDVMIYEIGLNESATKDEIVEKAKTKPDVLKIAKRGGCEVVKQTKLHGKCLSFTIPPYNFNFYK